MKTSFYNLAGGINQASTKTELGLDTNRLYWTDSKNMEIHQNKGIIRQRGNTLLTQLPDEEKIVAMHQMKYAKVYNLLIATESGKLYVYNPRNQKLSLLDKTASGKSRLNFADYLNGVLVSSQNDPLFFVKNNSAFDVISCELKNGEGEYVTSDVIAVHKGRVWVAEDASIYFSALGKYDDFTTENDAGYINNFHTDTDEIIALKPYKDYLAIYKKHMVYLLTGTSIADFAIVPFANKGATSFNGVVNVDNKQYFLNQGVFALEQVGELNQIQLGSETTVNIKPEFEKFDRTKFDKVIAINYERKNQVWYFIPYKEDQYFHTIWINDYLNKSWFKRVVPQNINMACLFNDSVLTADVSGKIYMEDFGTSFDGEPIEFFWKSPFLSVGDTNVRKTIEEFYFVLDESYDNNFHFSVYKNYDSEYKDDIELVHSASYENLIWDKEESEIEQNFIWDSDETSSLWATSADTVYKAEISESNYSVQLCVEGSSIGQNAAIIGLEFKEIYVDD